MVDYTASLIWLVLWSLIIFLGYKFTAFNMDYFTRIERFIEKEGDISQ